MGDGEFDDYQSEDPMEALFSSEYQAKILLYDAPSYVMSGICLIVGVCMNILVLLVLCAGDPGDSRSPTSVYLTHMALADLLYLSFIPLTIIEGVTHEFKMSSYICTYKLRINDGSPGKSGKFELYYHFQPINGSHLKKEEYDRKSQISPFSRKEILRKNNHSVKKLRAPP